jgi:hypothetical protein
VFDTTPTLAGLQVVWVANVESTSVINIFNNTGIPIHPLDVVSITVKLYVPGI